MAAKQNVLAVLVVLISSLVTSVQLNVAMLTVHFNYIKRGVLDTRVNPDTCGRADSIRIRIRVDAETFQSGKKSLWIQKYPDTCGRGLNIILNVGFILPSKFHVALLPCQSISSF